MKLNSMIVSFIFLANFAYASEISNCGNNEEARLLVKLIKEDRGQKRRQIRCNKMLTVAAEAKAKKMAEFGLVAHNLGGSPNSRLERLGYKLPRNYGWQFNSNQVEAVAGGYSDAYTMWEVFKRSDVHRVHLLGEHEFYLEQDEIGAAFVEKWDSPHVEYWVVYLTKGYKKDQSYSESFINILSKASFELDK